MKKGLRFSFPVTFSQETTAVTDQITKTRARIFYKGYNRNGSLITESFANQLVDTLPYAPVKGIHNGEDYEGHKDGEGQIYGVVPESNNFAWETHLDEDGVTRTYACADAYLYTALYEEAKDIPGKSLSMELYPPSVEGDFVQFAGSNFFELKKGSFYGLQILGDAVEPCFEGASFYSKDEKKGLMDFLRDVKQQEDKMKNKNFELQEDQDVVINVDEAHLEIEEDGTVSVNDAVVEAAAPEVDPDPAVEETEETNEVAQPETVVQEEPETTEEAPIEPADAQPEAIVQEEEEAPVEEPAEEAPAVEDNLVQEPEPKEEEQLVVAIDDNGHLIVLKKNDEENKHFTLASDYIAEMQNELVTLRSIKEERDNELREQVFQEFSASLTDEELQAVKDNSANLTVEELRKELAYQVYESNKGKETNFSASLLNRRIPSQKDVDGVVSILESRRNKN